ncbi:unnamed protein product [Notodromas monacha]|uniref:Uncharacterized protein n=1 Tax=Notodromas monacha TaxID=399045 RepID=A0A7R9BFP5_9CRUS|nr:unnamed protein product [Notodromas monacha]CAG0914578.1 unnamed protein product [Notodromas monacha]
MTGTTRSGLDLWWTRESDPLPAHVTATDPAAAPPSQPPLQDQQTPPPGLPYSAVQQQHHHQQPPGTLISGAPPAGSTSSAQAAGLAKDPAVTCVGDVRKVAPPPSSSGSSRTFNDLSNLLSNLTILKPDFLIFLKE